ncbi:MAG: sulfite exporter TauE/SafE family protein, partial [Mesorhizobium sp.]
MTFSDAVLLFLAGFASGAANAVAGGGTFLTFGAMTLVGLPPIVANATSSVTQLPGYITSTLAYWTDIRYFWRAERRDQAKQQRAAPEVADIGPI